MRPRTLAALPEIPTGYPLEGSRSWWSVVIPLARTNLVDDQCSFETGIGASTAAVGSGSVARTTDEQYHGVYSLAITPTATTTDGARAFQWNPTANTTYAFSCKMKGRAGVPYRFYVGDTGATEQSGIHFRGTGRWQWVAFLWKATAITARLFLRKDGSTNTGVFYWDGIQVESCADGVLAATTYIDGNEQGLVANEYPPAYSWTGTPHQSTSVRSGQTRAGGYVVPLNRYGFILAAMIGLGSIGGQHVATPYAQLDGAHYERTVKGARDITLVGRFQGRTPAQLDRLRSGLSAVLDRDVTGQQQPLTLLYQRWEGDRAVSDAGRLTAVYTGGLEGNADNLFAETAPISFTTYLPFVQADREQGAALDVQESVTNANYIIRRTADGVWEALGTGMNDSVLALAYGPNGSLYAAGTFTLAGGVANTVRVARWDGITWLPLSTGANGAVQALAFGPDGSLYAVGDFTTIGGVAANRVARWNGSAWSALGTGITGGGGTVLAVAVDSTGNVFVTGNFTTAGGGAAASIAKWNGSAWSALGTGLNNTGRALAIARNGDLYAGGDFTTAGGTAVSRIAKWNGSAWSALSDAPSSGDVRSLVFGIDQTLYMGGSFTATNAGVTLGNIGRWNGVGWQALGSGMNNPVNKILPLPSGELIVAGSFSTASGSSVPDGIATWNGASWTAFEVDLTGTPPTLEVYALAERAGVITIGFNQSGTATAAGLTTVTNTGTAKSFPTLTIKGPSSGTSRVYQLINVTTGRRLFFSGTVNAGETWRLSLDPANLSFVSDFQGNLSYTILPGSNEADFFLQPGANVISFFAADSSVTATLAWRPNFARIDDLTV